MKNSKFFALALAVLMFAAFMAGCAKTPTATPDQSAAPATAQPGTSAPTDNNTGKDGKDLKIVTLLNGTLGDRSFFDSANEGSKMIAEKFGATTKVVEVGYDQTRWEPTLADLCDEDWDIIICGTWQMADLVQNYAPQFPEKKFIIFDTTVDFAAADLSNVYAMEFKQNEGSYLAGLMGAMLSNKGENGYNADKVIGFVGGNDTPVINDFLVGYIQGAQAADAQSKVIVSYVYDFADAAKAKELTLAQYNQKADIVFSVAATAGLGVLDAAKERGLYAIGVDADQAELFAETDVDKANLIPSSMLKRVDTSMVRAIEKVLDGTLPWGANERLGIAEGSIGLAKNEFYEKLVPQDVRDAVEAAEAKILSGEITVQSAYGMQADQVRSIIDSVKP